MGTPRAVPNRISIPLASQHSDKPLDLPLAVTLEQPDHDERDFLGLDEEQFDNVTVTESRLRKLES
jgi:hypothetical protein